MRQTALEVLGFQGSCAHQMQGAETARICQLVPLGVRTHAHRHGFCPGTKNAAQAATTTRGLW